MIAQLSFLFWEPPELYITSKSSDNNAPSSVYYVFCHDSIPKFYTVQACTCTFIAICHIFLDLSLVAHVLFDFSNPKPHITVRCDQLF